MSLVTRVYYALFLFWSSWVVVFLSFFLFFFLPCASDRRLAGCMRSCVLVVFLVWSVPFWSFFFLRLRLSSPGLFVFCFCLLASFLVWLLLLLLPSPPCVFWLTWYDFPRRLLPPLLPTVSGGVFDLATVW